MRKDMDMSEYRSLQRPDKDIRITGVGVTGTCEQPNMGAGIRIQILCKSVTCSYLWSQLTSPHNSKLNSFIFK